ncbi:MAG: adenine deaminase [Acidimicrobiales bacterium]|nr:adenine deaminase [Acidimicrobiales bacterium]
MARSPISLRALAAARGDEPADLLLTGGRVFSPATREWIATDLAIADGRIVAWGHREALEVLDIDGASVTPAFVDAHMHLESTKLWVDEFVRAVLPHGTTAVAADPHEVGNVFGIEGIVALAQAAEGLPFTFGVCASASVPVSHWESAGAVIDSAGVGALLSEHGAVGVAEIGDWRGAAAGDPEVLAKIAAAGHRRVDGHAPGLTGAALDAFLTAGVESDHECVHYQEALEKRRKGMWVFAREGSASRNLRELSPLLTRFGTDLVALCTDDREPHLLRTAGHVNDCARIAVDAGVRMEDALVAACTNGALYHGFRDLGHLGPGFQADVLVFDDLSTWEPSLVLQRGRVVARDGELVEGAVPDAPPPAWMRHSVRLGSGPEPEAFVAPEPTGLTKVIGLVPGTILTTQEEVDLATAGPEVALIALVERHRGSGRLGTGYVTGFGPLRGALASTVAHDAHNVVVVGPRTEAGRRDMAQAVARLAELGGGQVAVHDGEVVGEIALPIAGLMSDRPFDEVADVLEAVSDAAVGIGATVDAPFMQLSFLALTAIPKLRITDRGVLDVDTFDLTDLAAT